MLYLLLFAIAVLLVGTLVAKVAARKDVRGEVDRFHQARTITSTWAQQGHAPRPAPKPERGEPDPAS